MRFRVGEPIEWADTWPAACAIHLDVPRVTHDTDHEGIDDLCVLPLYDEWEVRETDRGAFEGGRLALREGPPQSPHPRAVGSAYERAREFVFGGE